MMTDKKISTASSSSIPTSVLNFPQTKPLPNTLTSANSPEAASAAKPRGNNSNTGSRKNSLAAAVQLNGLHPAVAATNKLAEVVSATAAAAMVFNTQQGLADEYTAPRVESKH